MAKIAKRLDTIRPFYVMEILARAQAMEAQGRSVIHMEIGEPDFPTPPAIVEAGVRALNNGYTHYTPALGLLELREAIANDYAPEVLVDASRVVCTPGASGALQLVFATLVGEGDEIIMADPGYPCNRHMVTLFGGRTVAVPVGPDDGFQLTADIVQQHWSDRTRAVMVASPSNPTGTVVPEKEMQAIAEFVQAKGGVLVVDEIYRRLSYEKIPATALSYPGDVIVINSFSKYQGMTGWRLGWLVAPQDYIDPIERLAQNIFIAPATPAQYAALAAFGEESVAELERRRLVFKERRDYLLPALTDLGFGISDVPQGAFYLYCDCSAFTDDSHAFASTILEETGVAITPGMDFGEHNASRYVRISYANELDWLKEGVERLRKFLA
ncbi:MAG: pyridoxal phosphate-dependent aminotransferase [Acidiferrobacterales bacterium]|nr:pyridoxal phosphate-dependent aminotransferase [Acidiferrobacterales bacterium]